MIPTQLSPFANHLWQSTLFSFLVLLLTLLLRRNRAQGRYWLWLAASLKFLVPFSLLISAGAVLDWQTDRPAPAPLPVIASQISEPFVPAIPEPPRRVRPDSPSRVPLLLAIVWLCGCLFLLARWSVRWRRLRNALRSASPLPLRAPIRVMSSPSRFEPGVFGILRPVLLLPQGIADHLTPAQLQSILAHELCHVRRRDNLAAALHMIVEALFWFHPGVYWIGSRLVEEREQACDEEVLRLGNAPEVYAAGILTVCRCYLESPLACAPGVTGSDLKKRIASIMSLRTHARVTPAQLVLIAAVFLSVIVGPVSVGVLHMPRVLAQTRDSGDEGLKFEVASIKPSDASARGIMIQIVPGGGLTTRNTTLQQLITFAYDIDNNQFSGGPGWIRSEHYDLFAKPDVPEPHEAFASLRTQRRLRERLRALLADRFRLTVHREPREGAVFLLKTGKNGPKLEETEEHGGIRRDWGVLQGTGCSMTVLAKVLTNIVGRPVLDQTELTGNYKFKVEWTDEAAVAAKGGPTDVAVNPNPPDPAGPSIFGAIQQLGLRLESAKGLIDHIVLDRVEKPTEN